MAAYSGEGSGDNFRHSAVEVGVEDGEVGDGGKEAH